MRLRIDPYSHADFIAKNIYHINVDIITAGCAGSKISLTARGEESHDERVASEEFQWLFFWVLPEYSEKIDGAQIAKAKGKYFLVSKNIQSRCGCGTSFSFEKKTVSHDLAKIHRLKTALSKSDEIKELKNFLKK